MIVSFAHKGLRQLFEDDNAKGVIAEHIRKVRQILAVLHAADTVEALGLPTFRLHELKGDLKGYWAITVRANWRIIFRFDGGKALDVDLVDYPLSEASMEMKNPPHPGGLIGDSLHELDVSIVEAAKALGITRQQLHNLIAGRSAITPEMAVKLEMAIGSTADAWLRMQMNYDLAQIRKRDIKVKRLAPA